MAQENARIQKENLRRQRIIVQENIRRQRIMAQENERRIREMQFFNNIFNNNQENLIKNEEEEKLIKEAIQKSLIENYKKKNEINEENKKNIKDEEEEEENFGICPITQDYMNNPVLVPSGNYYEKEAILNWIRVKGDDPLTREPLSPDQLIEDHDYRNAIIEYRRKHNK